MEKVIYPKNADAVIEPVDEINVDESWIKVLRYLGENKRFTILMDSRL